ncbi:MAG: hypothetical protein KFF72_14260 [Arthrospira sp. SH-MAG29]|nr:hypothetical protein [Arthrospira sp. SH-MAG29]MBS0017490.1 hypothetical protein [Arthrospira sp. SH-MAG29]
MLELMETFHLWEYQLRIYRVFQEYRIELSRQGRYYLHQKSFSDLDNCVLWAWLELTDRLETSLTEDEWLTLSQGISQSQNYRQWLKINQLPQGPAKSSVAAAI